MSSAVTVRGLRKYFPVSGGVVRAVDDVDLDIAPGKTLGLVGESGSGKSTVGRCLLRLIEPTAGEIRYGDLDVRGLDRQQLRRWRAAHQMVFQDPYESMNPRLRVADLLAEPMQLHTRMDAGARLRRAGELLEMVRLERRHLTRYPHELSGGQLQRIGIARALALEPKFLVLDEPTSSLDLSVRAGVLALLKKLQRELNITYLLVSHDLETVAAYCDTVAVMYLGRIVERGPTAQLFANPQHPYTQALLSASLSVDPTVQRPRIRLQGEIPSAMGPRDGCLFASRCPLVRAECTTGIVDARRHRDGHEVACVRMDDGTNLIRPHDDSRSERTRG
jgi:oligopeptide/dipeptide ABC transporter ATP-binding protein